MNTFHNEMTLDKELGTLLVVGMPAFDDTEKFS